MAPQETYRWLVEVLLQILPAVLAGVVLLTVEYLTPWFAARLPKDQQLNQSPDLPPPTLPGREAMQRVARRIPKPYLEDSPYEVGNLLVHRIRRLGESHLELYLEVVPTGRFFRAVCTPEGDVAKVTEVHAYDLPLSSSTAPKTQSLFSLPSITVVSLFWLLGAGLTLALMRSTFVLSELYRSADLDVFSRSPLLMILISTQMTVLSPILITFLANTLRNLGVRILIVSAAYVAFPLWVFLVALLGLYPESVQQWIDNQIPLRTAFQSTYLAYQTTAVSEIIWITDAILATIANGLVLIVSIILANILAKVFSWEEAPVVMFWLFTGVMLITGMVAIVNRLVYLDTVMLFYLGRGEITVTRALFITILVLSLIGLSIYAWKSDRR